MNKDFFQIVRRDGASAVKELSFLDDVNIQNEEGQNLLHCALAYGNTPAAIELIRMGIDLNTQDNKGQTPLHFAALYKNNDVASTILKSGGLIDTLDMYGNSPLWTAVFNARGTYSLVETLAQHGATRIANSKNKSGRSPVDFATQIGDDHLVSILNG